MIVCAGPATQPLRVVGGEHSEVSHDVVEGVVGEGARVGVRHLLPQVGYSQSMYNREPGLG